MGRRAVKKNKEKKCRIRGTYSDWNTAARTVKREQLDLIAGICGTTRDTTGEVQRLPSTNNEYDDGAAAATDERAATSESITADSDTSTSTV